VAKYKKEGHVHDLPRSGRPPTLSKADKQILTDVVEEHPTYALREITKASGLNVSHPMVDKVLKEAGYTLHIKHKKPYLKLEQHHKLARLDWCHCRQKYNQNY
jgi:transposase